MIPQAFVVAPVQLIRDDLVGQAGARGLQRDDGSVDNRKDEGQADHDQQNVNPDTADPPFDPVSTINFTATTLAEALADNQDDHEEYQDYTWNSSDVVNITLNKDSISVDGTGTEINGTTLTIKSAGAYLIRFITSITSTLSSSLITPL